MPKHMRPRRLGFVFEELEICTRRYDFLNADLPRSGTDRLSQKVWGIAKISGWSMLKSTYSKYIKIVLGSIRWIKISLQGMGLSRTELRLTSMGWGCALCATTKVANRFLGWQ